MQKTECFREEFEQKYKEEQLIRIQTEQEVRDMEKREAELIERWLKWSAVGVLTRWVQIENDTGEPAVRV